MDGVLFFDGACGMCTRSVYFLVRRDRTGSLRTEPSRRPAPLTASASRRPTYPNMAWWLDESGAVYGGAEALNAALSTALGSRLPLLIYRIPGIRLIQNTVYRWVANHRYRFPGTTPYCESHPVAC